MLADIKFCGLTRPEDAQFAAQLGAAYVGVIFAGGPRMLTVDQAERVLAEVPSTVRRVGVFADHAPAQIASIASRLQLSVVQLHGECDADRIAAIRAGYAGSIWTVCRIAGGELPEDAQQTFGLGDGLLLDSYTPGARGGTGIPLPWAALRDALIEARRWTRQLVLAGGLRPENVGAAIAAVGPDVVDVSSGVERAPGIKDHDRMRAFRDAVLAALDP